MRIGAADERKFSAFHSTAKIVPLNNRAFLAASGLSTGKWSPTRRHHSAHSKGECLSGCFVNRAQPSRTFQDPPERWPSAERRSQERRGGRLGVSTCRSGWLTVLSKKKT